MAVQHSADVVIVGGGLAGLLLARQLKLHRPGTAVTVLDRSPRPLRRFAHKVGESVLSPQGWYLGEHLQLREYLDTVQVSKWGTRYFFPLPAGERDSGFSARPEVGPTNYAVGIDEWQLDRGGLENDLRKMAARAGVRLWEGYTVTDVAYDRARGVHTVRAAADRGNELRLSGRWLVDASGRSRLLCADRAGSVRAQQHSAPCSAAWWRVRGWIDVEDFARDDGAWLARVDRRHPKDAAFGRVNSTIHLCNRGSWVWLIPLPDAVMSVGIVAMDALEPVDGYDTHEKATAWLEEREPLLASALGGREVLDFHVLRRYSYPAGDLLGADRRCSVGEALGFSDPFYSPGGDNIAIMNLLVQAAMDLDGAGDLDDTLRGRINSLMRFVVAVQTAAIHSMYPCLGHSRVSACRVVWDYLALVNPARALIEELATRGPDLLRDPDRIEQLHRWLGCSERIAELSRRMGKELAADPALAHLRPRQMVDHRNVFAGLWRLAMDSVPDGRRYAQLPVFSAAIAWSVRIDALERVEEAVAAFLTGLLNLDDGAAASGPSLSAACRRMVNYLRLSL